MIGKARRKTRAVSFAERVNQRVAVFLADLTVLVAVFGHQLSFGSPYEFGDECVAPTFGGWGLEEVRGHWRGRPLRLVADRPNWKLN
jgi:hypothetical protein